MFRVTSCFAPRPVRWIANVDHAGWRIKRYHIWTGDSGPGPLKDFDAHLAAVSSGLPQPPADSGRPGVAFAIFHAGRGVDYVVLNWWDRENELSSRVWVRGQAPDDAWRAARDGESCCVWDLEAIWFERQAYVRHVLARPERPDVAAYCAEAWGAGQTVRGTNPAGPGEVARHADRLELSDPAAYRERLIRQVAGRAPLDVLAETPAALNALVDAHPAERLRVRPFEGKWTALEVIGHLCDAEWVFGYRTRTIFADERPELIGMDQDRWVAAQGHNEREPRDLLDEFTALRRVNLRLWRSLPAAALQRSGLHRERGEEQLGQILAYAAGHDLWHQDQFRRYVAAAGG